MLRALKSMRHTTTDHLQQRLITEVSGGERQRVMVARALAQDTRLLLLDEATSCLDVRKKLEIFELLNLLNQTQGLTVLCAMHDLNLAALYCGRLMFLKDGELCVCQVMEMLGLAPSTVSKHLDILRRAGLLESRKEGRWMFYRLGRSTPQVRQAISFVQKALADQIETSDDAKRLRSVKKMEKDVLCCRYKGLAK